MQKISFGENDLSLEMFHRDTGGQSQMSLPIEVFPCPNCGNPVDDCVCVCPYCGEIEADYCVIGYGAATGG